MKIPKTLQALLIVWDGYITVSTRCKAKTANVNLGCDPL